MFFLLRILVGVWSTEYNTNSGGSELRTSSPRAVNRSFENGGRTRIIDESKAQDYVIGREIEKKRLFRFLY